MNSACATRLRSAFSSADISLSPSSRLISDARSGITNICGSFGFILSQPLSVRATSRVRSSIVK